MICCLFCVSESEGILEADGTVVVSVSMICWGMPESAEGLLGKVSSLGAGLLELSVEGTVLLEVSIVGVGLSKGISVSVTIESSGQILGTGIVITLELCTAKAFPSESKNS